MREKERERHFCVRVLPGMYMCVINNQQVVLHAAGCDW